MSDKKTVSQWLRNKDAFEGAEAAPPTSQWREALLADYEHPTMVQAPVEEPERRAPLQVHHLVLMAPAGVALFGLGWMFGNGAVALEQVARISPLVWMGLAVSGSLGFLVWRGRGRGLLGRR